MNSERTSQWIEIIAAIGVILSLLFVGFEIRQNTAIARGQARQDLAQLNQEWLILLGQDAEFEALWDRAFMQGASNLTPQEIRRSDYIMTMHLRRLENVYLQFREGLVEEAALRNYGFAATELFQRPQFDRYWIDRGWRNGFDVEFVNLLDSVRESTREEDAND